MHFTKTNTYLALSIGVLLMGCGSSYDDDDPAAVNTPPVAVSVDLITQADTAIVDMLSGTDADGDALNFSIAEQPTQGTLTLDSDGSFTYQPNSTVTGTDSFSFTVSDVSTQYTSASDTGTVNITIESQIVSLANYSRLVFAQNETDTPLPTNGRDFTQDVTDPNAFNDLLNSQ
jgi:VCBS repeat-containing protein